MARVYFLGRGGNTPPNLATPPLKQGVSLQYSLLDHFHWIALSVERARSHALPHELVCNILFEVLIPLRK
jgi:hypothetical protein